MNFHKGRWAILIGWLTFSFFKLGGISGMFYGFLLFGLMACAWYMVFDTWHRLQGAVRRPNVTNQTLNMFVTPEDLATVQARRGRPVDTTDDFAGMIEYRKNASK